MSTMVYLIGSLVISIALNTGTPKLVCLIDALLLSAAYLWGASKKG